MAVRTKADIEKMEVNSAGASCVLGCTVQHFNFLVREGRVKPVGKNRYLLTDVVQGQKLHLQDENRRTTKTAATSRMQDMKTQEIEFRLAKERNEWMPVEDAIAVQGKILGTIRSELAALPAACSRDLSIRADIEKQVNGLVERSVAAFKGLWEALRSGNPVILDDEETDA